MRGDRLLRLLLASVIVGAGASCSEPPPGSLARLPSPWPPDDAAIVRKALKAELRTVTLTNCTLRRYGNDNDGGYLMCGNLSQGVESAYSYGIRSEDTWGCDVANQSKVPIHQYDCFTDERPTCEGGQFIFHDECVGPKQETLDGNLFDTVASQIAKNGDTGKRLLVKMDIEGAEWASLMAMPDDALDQIVQLPMEFHGTDDPKFVELVRRLKQKFYLVNLHYNNYQCGSPSVPLPSSAFQVLWVNKKVGTLDPDGPSPAPQSPLNMPDNPKARDCQVLDEERQ